MWRLHWLAYASLTFCQFLLCTILSALALHFSITIMQEFYGTAPASDEQRCPESACGDDE